jgi:hypothetical protein
MTDVAIVGAGPAGLTAAIFAARAAARVVVCEHLPRAGAKLLASGGGRCNVTNTASEAQFVAAFGRQGRFILPALRGMDGPALRRFLFDLGVGTHAADGFHVFAATGRAADVLAVLLRECRRLGVAIRLHDRVSALRLAGGRVEGVETAHGPLAAPAVIVACGGKGYRGLGGTGDGYVLARQAGHDVTEPVPALVGLVTKDRWPAACSGVSVPAVRLRIDLPRWRGQAAAGDVLFAHRGLSGPAALDLSGAVAELLRKHQAVPLALELLPGTTAGSWQQRFDAWQRDAGRKHIRNLLGALLPRRLADALCRLAGDLGDTPAAELPRAGREALIRLLTAAPLTVTATAGFEKAMVTRGGVALKQVDPRTLASRLLRGLYFAGEVLDLDGPSGGYNLQWAFSSGRLAGVSCHAAPGKRRSAGAGNAAHDES